VLRAERSAATLRFARNTGGKCAKPCKVKQVGLVMFSKLVVQNAMQMLQDGIFLHMMILICRS
jgi:hypothetical protein